MIIGHPIMVGGGGKNISSIIITGLESTDTITCTKDGKSYTATWDSTAKHWEIVGLPFGTFTVTATNGTKTITETVLIDITGVYEIEMSFNLWLYKDGDECTDVTGGWIAQGLGDSASYNYPDQPTLTKNTSNMTMSRSKNLSYRCGIILPVNKIDLSDYNSINVVLDISGFNDASFSGCYIRKSLGNYVSDGTRWYSFNKSNNGQTNINASYNISSISGLYVPYFSLYHDGYVTFHKIWLE